MHEGQFHRTIIFIFTGPAYQDADASDADSYGCHDNGPLPHRCYDAADLSPVPGLRRVRESGVEDHKASDSGLCAVLPAEFPLCNAFRGGTGIFLPSAHE